MSSRSNLETLRSVSVDTPDGAKASTGNASATVPGRTGRLAPQDQSQATVTSVILGVLAALTMVSSIIGTVIHLGHHDDTFRNLLIAVGAGAVATRYLYPVVATHLRIPGYSLPPELQDLI